MLTESQASEIVQSSISKTVGRKVDLKESLFSAGISQENLRALES